MIQKLHTNEIIQIYLEFKVKVFRYHLPQLHFSVGDNHC